MRKGERRPFIRFRSFPALPPPAALVGAEFHEERDPSVQAAGLGIRQPSSIHRLPLSPLNSLESLSSYFVPLYVNILGEAFGMDPLVTGGEA